MKKLWLIGLFLASLITNAQISVLDYETNTAINDSDIITVDQDHYTTHFIVTNNYSYDINLRIEVVNIVNTNGHEMTLCFGVLGHGSCHYPIAIGDQFDGGAPLPAGASTLQADIDVQHNENGNFSTYPKDYELRISALNPSDNSVLSSVTFTYRYDPNGQAINTFDKNDIIIATGYHVVNIISKYHAKVSFYNLTGQKVKEVYLKPEQNHVYIGNMTSGIYIVHVLAGDKELFKKIIIK